MGQFGVRDNLGYGKLDMEQFGILDILEHVTIWRLGVFDDFEYGTILIMGQF